MIHYFSSDRTNISLYVEIDIGYKSMVASKKYVVKYCTFLKLVCQNNNELPGKSMAFKIILSRF